ncbi:MAG: hypothetical protein AAGF92_03255 [Myxococcota bacterium]
MRELTTVALVFLALVGLAYAIAFVGQPEVYQGAWLLMTALGAGAVVAEVLYFAGLYASLKRNGTVPPRWYARSFEHHGLMTRAQRGLVLPFFYLGALGLVVALAIAVVLVFASFGLFRDLPR